MTDLHNAERLLMCGCGAEVRVGHLDTGGLLIFVDSEPGHTGDLVIRDDGDYHRLTAGGHYPPSVERWTEHFCMRRP